MRALKGKILMVVACLVAVISIAGCAVGGYMLGAYLEQTMGTMLVAYNWAALSIGLAVSLAVLAALMSVPGVITSIQVSHMYDVSAKFACWSTLSTVLGLVMLLLTGAAAAGTWIALGDDSLALLLAVLMGLTDVMPLRIGACALVVFLCVALFLPMMLSLRVRDNVQKMLRKKRNRSRTED